MFYFVLVIFHMQTTNCKKIRRTSYQHVIIFSVFSDGSYKPYNLIFFFFNLRVQRLLGTPRPGGSVVSVSDSWPGGCEFEARLRRAFFPAYFRLSSLQKHVRKVVGGFEKKSCVSAGVRKPGNTYHDMTLAVKVALNPNTNKQTIL